MSVSKWAYRPDKCDGQPCPGDCDYCDVSWEDEIEDFSELQEGFEVNRYINMREESYE